MITITNRNLSVDDPQWICEPLKRVELTARAIYYIARTLRFLEL